MQSIVPVVFSLVAALFALAALYVAGLAVAFAVDHNPGFALVLLVISALASYGAYLFARAGLRIHRQLRTHPLNPAQRTKRRARAWQIAAYYAVATVSNLALPLPPDGRVVMIVTGFIVIPAILAVAFEPPKRKGS
jgi:hypothetical protein